MMAKRQSMCSSLAVGCVYVQVGISKSKGWHELLASWHEHDARPQPSQIVLAFQIRDFIPFCWTTALAVPWATMIWTLRLPALNNSLTCWIARLPTLQTTTFKSSSSMTFSAIFWQLLQNTGGVTIGNDWSHRSRFGSFHFLTILQSLNTKKSFRVNYVAAESVSFITIVQSQF